MKTKSNFHQPQATNLNRFQNNPNDYEISGRQLNATEILSRQIFLDKEGGCDELRNHSKLKLLV